jgi:D-specific alpha-keto acid dehydrogenase
VQHRQHRVQADGHVPSVLEGEEGIFYADRRETPIENELWLRLHRLPNVVISPHTAYYTDHALRDAVEHSLANCLNFQHG